MYKKTNFIEGKKGINKALQQKSDIDYLYEKLNELQNRINKAIEYIGEPYDNYWEEEAKELLNILEGKE